MSSALRALGVYELPNLRSPNVKFPLTSTSRYNSPSIAQIKPVGILGRTFRINTLSTPNIPGEIAVSLRGACFEKTPNKSKKFYCDFIESIEDQARIKRGWMVDGRGHRRGCIVGQQ